MSDNRLASLFARNPLSYGETPALDSLSQDGVNYDTADILRRIRKPNALVDALRVSANAIPENKDHSVSLVNMLRGGLGSAANWLDGNPEIGKDTLAPLGMGMMAAPFAPTNALGVFGGRLAKTADHAALAKAEEMAAKGADRQAIWDQTGWFRGADGKWRFEIDDSASKWLVPGPNHIMPGHQIKGPVDIMVQHGALAEGYPDIMSRPVQYYKPREVTGPLDAGRYFPDRDGFAIRAFDGGNPHSTLLHELQHGIQQREGFARGSNPASEAVNVKSDNPIIKQMREDFARRLFEEPGFRGSKQAISEWDRIMRLETQDVDGRADDLYRRRPGEIEARNVENRMRMTPDERRARPPWETEDVPPSNQLFRGTR